MNTRIVQSQPLNGGMIAQTFPLDLADERSMVAKFGHLPDDTLARDAYMLNYLAENIRLFSSSCFDHLRAVLSRFGC